MSSYLLFFLLVDRVEVWCKLLLWRDLLCAILTNCSFCMILFAIFNSIALSHFLLAARYARVLCEGSRTRRLSEEQSRSNGRPNSRPNTFLMNYCRRVLWLRRHLPSPWHLLIAHPSHPCSSLRSILTGLYQSNSGLPPSSSLSVNCSSLLSFKSFCCLNCFGTS